MPHDHSEDDGDNEPIVESTPPRVLGLAAHMKAQSEGESSQPQGFFIMPQQDGLKSSVMPIGAHADGSGHIHGPNCGCGDHGDAQKTNPPHGQPGHVCGAEGKANDHQPKQKREMRATVYAASGIGYLARKISGDRIGKNFKDWTSRNNANVVLPVAGLFTLASIINKDPTLAAIGTLTAPVVMNDAVDNFMRAARSLEDKHQIPRQTTAALATFSHAGSEIASAGINTFKGLTDESVNAATKLGINLTSTFISQVSHMGTMFFGAATVGRMGFVNRKEWFAHLKGITSLSAGLAVPVIGDAAVQSIPESLIRTSTDIANRGAGTIVSSKSATWYFGKLDEFGDECPVCGEHHGGKHDKALHSELGDEQEKLEKESLITRFKRHAKGLPKATQEYVVSIPHHMAELPKNTAVTLKGIYDKSKLIITDKAGRDATKSVATVAVSSWAMLHNIDVVAAGHALKDSAAGALHGYGHSLPETIFILRAAIEGDKRMAIGAFGGCMSAMGILGGALLIGGADIAESLRDPLYMGSFIGFPAAALAFSYPEVMERIGKVDDTASKWLQRNLGDRLKGVSNWLGNDGTSVSRFIAITGLTASLLVVGKTASESCHVDGSYVHCFDSNIEASIDPTFD